MKPIRDAYLVFAGIFLLIGNMSLQARPFANVPVIEHVPSVSQLSDSRHVFWKSALHISGFTEFNQGRSPKWDTEVCIAASKENLYVQICGHIEPGSRRVSVESKRDGRVYHDECLELALAYPDAPEGEYYQFTINTKNTIYDAYKVDSSWNSNAETAVAVSKGQWWSATLRIPFSDLGFDKMPHSLLCNVARTTLSPESEQSVLVRSSRNLFFGNMKEALLLRFGEDLPSGSFYETSTDEGRLIRAKALSLPSEKFADFCVSVLDAQGKKVCMTKGQVRFDSLQTELKIPFLKDGNYTFDISMLQAKEHQIPAYYGGGTKPNEMLKSGQKPETYMHFSWPVTVDNAPRLECSVRLRDEGRILNAVLTPRSVFCSDEAEYRLALWDEAGKKVVRQLGKISYKEGAQLFECSLDGLPERSRYLLKAELHDNGELVAASNTKMATPPFPVWKGYSSCGPDENTVPAPWGPVSLDGLTVECWGRKYEFSASSPIPVQIVSQETQLLSRPCRIVSSPAIEWKLQSAQKMSASKVRLDYSGICGGSMLSAFTEIYFDGTVRTDLEIPSEADLSLLYLEVSYRKEIADYLHFGPGVFGGMLNIHKCDRQEMFPVIPNIMLLNDNVGLGWFDGMQFDWPLAKPDEAVKVTPENKETVLRVNYIDEAKRYERKRRFSFGLQALPARPMPAREEAMRLCYAVRYGDEERIAWLSSVDYQPQGNIDIKRGTIEFKVLVPKAGERDRLALISHGDANQFSIEIDESGRIIAHTQEYWSEKWRLASSKAMEPGKWHNVACTWGDGSIELWLDNGVVAKSAQPELMRIFPANISIGSRNCVLDELRISSIKRERFDNAEPLVDDATLLCDNFDSMTYVNGRKATIPKRISAEAECGYILPDTNIVKGLRGKAVGPMKVAPRSLIEGYAALGFQAMCYHASQYTDEAFAGLYIADEKRFRSSLNAIHKAGMKGIIYVGNGISTYDRAWDAYADEWLIEPRMTPFISASRPYEKGYQACPRSGYIQYFFQRIGKLMDDYGIDGIFLDGRLDAQCSNARHGCGVENLSGEKVSGRDVWTCWRNAWWLYNIVQSRGGYCEQHKSGNWNIPSCFFWNGVWEGEQLMGVRLNGRKRLELVPLEAMRGEINGIPYGMPSRNTAYSYAPFTPVENCTMSFVHGTTWTMTYRIEEGHVVSPYWHVLEKFGACKQNFLGYWAKQPPAMKTCDELVKVSAYVKKGQSLLIVANFNEDSKRIAGEIVLNLQALNIKHPRMRNAFSGQEVPVSADGRFSIDLKSFRQDWFIVEEKK